MKISDNMAAGMPILNA